MSARPPTLPEEGAGTKRAGSDEFSPVAALLMLVILLMPFPVVLVKFTAGSRSYDYQAILFPSDLPLMLLTLAMLPRVVARARTRTLGAAGWLVLALTSWLLVSFAFHPSARGVADLVRLAGVLAMIVAVIDLKKAGERAIVLASMGGVAIFETVIATLQLIRHAPVGLNALGEFKDPFWLFGTASAPQGTIVHPYILAGLALVAAFTLAIATSRTRERTLLLAAATALAVAPLGFTYSRAGVLGFGVAVLIVATGLLRGRATRAWYLPAVIALCVGAAIPALVWNSGWVSRTKQSVSARSGSQLSTDRGRLIREADGLIADHPIVGVGPGRYVIALRDRYDEEGKKHAGVFKPVHNLPLLLAAEGGIPAGLAMTLLLLVVGWQAFRSGPWALALYVAYLPFALLDHFPYSFPQGLIITGFWLGVLNLLAGERVHPVEPATG
ncbi:MAG: hypothetical protein JWP02_2685 [Acidimicrobiales bacterium]|nr:hypothetical protein [Acidimicrobiales bacterium]